MFGVRLFFARFTTPGFYVIGQKKVVIVGLVPLGGAFVVQERKYAQLVCVCVTLSPQALALTSPTSSKAPILQLSGLFGVGGLLLDVCIYI